MLTKSFSREINYDSSSVPKVPTVGDNETKLSMAEYDYFRCLAVPISIEF